MDMCRACLCTNTVLKIITEDCLRNYFLLTQIQVQPDSALSQTMCSECWNTIDSFIGFRNKCIQSEATLHSKINLTVKLEDQPILDGVKVEMETVEAMVHSPLEGVDFNDDLVQDIEFKHETCILQKLSAPDHKSTIKCKMKGTKAAVRKQGNTKVSKSKKTEILSKSSKKIIIDSLTDDVMLSCGLCAKSCIDRTSLSVHLEDHKRDSTCLVCEETYKPWPRLLGHRLNHLQEESQSHCHVCWEPYSQTDYALEYHYYKMHYDGEFPGLQCKRCCKMYPTAQRLKRHIWAYHSSKQYICDYCSKVYHNKHHLSNHLIHHSNEKRYFCDKCNFACKLKGGLTEHKLRKHTEVKYKCKGCHAKFGNREAYERHNVKCQTYVICPTCGRSMNKTNLIQHMKSHSDEKPYKCDRCPAMYKSKRALQVHMDKHHSSQPRMGEKRFQCTICDKRYTANHNLKIHMRTHGPTLVDRRGQAYELFNHR